ncbi:feruloyl-CoA synthase [Mesobacterium pallidum]|uniref:feruloyl-CoA synthase n=1 Tax=Mesobacterium pallidum TaxID=2872037 RepID=UPI001EE2DEBA|nr:feruloyl-CoA synthase [Mesobacterium pallidum]
MTDAPIRPVRLWQPDVKWEKRSDGSIIVWQEGELLTYPARIADRVRFWADYDAKRLWMAERDATGAWAGVTYGELYLKMYAIGQVLLDLKLSVERPLVILSGNSVAHGMMALAAQFVGIPSAAIAPAYSLVSKDFEKLKSVRDQITPGAVFAENMDDYAAAVEAVFPDLPRLGKSGAGLHISWQDMLATEASDRVEAVRTAVAPKSVAKFLFTSGTTGSPKAVIQTHLMLCANMEMMTDCYDYLRDEPPIILDWAPWNHVAAGNLVFNAAVYNGGTFYIDGGRPTRDGMAETIRNLREINTNWYWNVPAGYEMLLEAMRDDAELAQAFFRDLKLMYYAGAAMAQHTWDELEEMSIKTTGQRVILATGLGATETAPFALFNTDPAAGPGNVGVPAKELQLKLVPNEGKWEARVKGPSVTPGYWRNKALSEEAFDKDGFYCLGDALRFADPEDPSKGFFFDGRVAENFKLGTGTWVAVGALRATLTNALGGLARDVVVVGEGHDELAALLVPFRPALEAAVAGGAEMSDAELIAHPEIRGKVAERLAAYNAKATGSSLRVPRAMFLVDPLDLDKGEVTDKGSVNQRAVLRHRAALTEVLYTDDPAVIVSDAPQTA